MSTFKKFKSLRCTVQKEQETVKRLGLTHSESLLIEVNLFSWELHIAKTNYTTDVRELQEEIHKLKIRTGTLTLRERDIFLRTWSYQTCCLSTYGYPHLYFGDYYYKHSYSRLVAREFKINFWFITIKVLFTSHLFFVPSLSLLCHCSVCSLFTQLFHLYLGLPSFSLRLPLVA